MAMLSGWLPCMATVDARFAQSTNGSLAEDGVYDWDASSKWLHRWSW